MVGGAVDTIAVVALGVGGGGGSGVGSGVCTTVTIWGEGSEDEFWSMITATTTPTVNVITLSKTTTCQLMSLFNYLSYINKTDNPPPNIHPKSVSYHSVGALGEDEEIPRKYWDNIMGRA